MHKYPIVLITPSKMANNLKEVTTFSIYTIPQNTVFLTTFFGYSFCNMQEMVNMIEWEIILNYVELIEAAK